MPTKLPRVRQYFISKHVLEALRPIFLMSFVYGLTPFRVVRHRNGDINLQMSVFGFLNIALYIILYGVCYIMSLLQRESVVGYFFRTNISIVGDTMQIFSGFITSTVIYISAVTQRHRLLRTIDIVHRLDENFANIGVKMKYSRIYRFSLVMIVFQILVIGVYLVGVFRLIISVNVTPSFCVCVTFFLQHSVLSIAICLFCFVARSFERRLLILHKVRVAHSAQQCGTQSKSDEQQKSMKKKQK